MKISRYGRLLAVVFLTCLGWGGSFDLQLAAQGSEEVQQIAAALDTNGNQLLDDGEIRQAVQFWIVGSVVPGTNHTISDATILALIRLWVTGEKITASPPGSTQIAIADVYLLELTADGHIAHGASISSAPAGSLITISGSAFPTNAMVQIDGIETSILDHSAQVLITFVPNVGTESKTVEIVISDKNNSAVKGTKGFAVEPLNTQSVADPTKTITDFIKAARTALGTATGNSDALALLNKLETALPIMSDGEKRSIAAGIKNSNVLLLAGKVQGTQGTAAASSNQQAVPVPADHLNTIEPSRAGLFRNVLDLTKTLNLPPLVDFSLTPKDSGEAIDEDGLSAVEGDQRNLRCYADVNGGISTITIAMQAGSDANFVDANGDPITGLTVEGVYNSTGAETLVTDWNSKVTGQARVVTFTCTAKDNLVFQQSQSRMVTLAVELSVSGDEPPPPFPVDCRIDEAGTFLSKWGSLGSDDGEFDDPSGVAVDGAGNLYVVDRGNDRIQKFDANGVFLSKWGSNGSGIGEFSYPSGIALDKAGNVYIADTENNRIVKQDANGMNPVYIGTFGTDNGQFSGPQGVALDGAGNLYVADTRNHRMQKFDANGDFVGWLGSQGSGDEQFKDPSGVAVDSAGNLYVVDQGNDRIQKFDVNGDFLSKWGSQGSGDGEFSFPYGVALDSAGNLYVADTWNDRIQKFDANGNFLTKWGTTSTSTGGGKGGKGGKGGYYNPDDPYGELDSEGAFFDGPQGVALDNMGNVYVADSGNHRIQKFCGGF